MTDEEKNIIINHRIQKSKETIEEAEVLLKNKKLRAVLNRIYYAIFYIVTALALKNDFSTSKHSQLLGWFNKNFIYTNKIDTKLYKIYSKAFSVVNCKKLIILCHSERSEESHKSLLPQSFRFFTSFRMTRNYYHILNKLLH